MVAEILKGLRTPLPPAAEGFRLEPMGGALPLDSGFYIKRPADEEFLTSRGKRDSILLLKGPRQIGKTSLLARGLQQAREAGAQVVLTDLQTLPEVLLDSEEKLFLTLAQAWADQLDLDVMPEEGWNPQRVAGMNLERYLRQEVLGALEQPLVWGLDEVDRLFSGPFSPNLFGLFRSWHNRRSLDPTGPWSRLTLAIAYATEAHLFISDLNLSPFNVGTRITLEDFTPGQVAELNSRYNTPLQNADELTRFYRLLHGQPYLVQRGFNEMVTHQIDFATLEAQADRDEGPFGDHLRRLLASLGPDADLTETVRGLLRGEPCPSPESFYRLRSAGVVTGNSIQETQFRCPLYRTYLERRLL